MRILRICPPPLEILPPALADAARRIRSQGPEEASEVCLRPADYEFKKGHTRMICYETPIAAMFDWEWAKK